MPPRPSRSVSGLMQLFKIGIRSIYDEEHRRLLAAYFQGPTQVHQPTSTTGLNRYPQTFERVRHILGDRPDLRLLSFGCSTGEEVVTLRGYFPTASLVGAEIDEKNLRACVDRKMDDRVTFISSDPRLIADMGPYDVIFAMAVLQYLPHLMIRTGVTDLRRLYPFAKFDAQLTLFDSWLKPRGLIVLQHTQYRFCDSSISTQYDPCGSYDAIGAGARLYDRHGFIIESDVYRDVVFRKREPNSR